MDTDKTMPPHKFKFVTPYMRDIQKNFLLYLNGKFYPFVFSKGRYTIDEGEEEEEKRDFEEVCIWNSDENILQTIGDDHVYQPSDHELVEKDMWDAAKSHEGVTFQLVGFHHPSGDLGSARDIVPIDGMFIVNRLGIAIVAERKTVEGKYPIEDYLYPIPAEDIIQRTFFDARDEAIDVLSNIDDFWPQGEDPESKEMKSTTYDRAESVLNLLERVRKALGYPNRPHDSVVSRDKSEESN